MGGPSVHGLVPRPPPDIRTERTSDRRNRAEIAPLGSQRASRGARIRIHEARASPATAPSAVVDPNGNQGRVGRRKIMDSPVMNNASHHRIDLAEM